MRKANKTYSNFRSTGNKDNISSSKWATSRPTGRKVKADFSSIEEEHHKEVKLLETLHDAEANQLQTFIKTRNKELDDDIKKIKSKLGTISFSMENDSLARKTTTNGSNLSITGEGFGKVNLEFQDSNNNDYFRNREASPTKRSLSPSHKDRLVTLLARMKLKMEDLDISPEELKEILLPSDLTDPGETIISLQELVNVLQTDLLIPVTKGDQMMLLREYSVKDSTEVDVKSLLQDAGVWKSEMDEDHFYKDDHVSGIRLNHSHSSPNSPSGTMKTKNSYLESPPSSPTMSKFYADVDNNNNWITANSSSKLKEFQNQQLNSTMHTSERNLSELSEFHNLIAMEDDFDLDLTSSSSSRPNRQSLSGSLSHFKTTLPVVLEEDETDFQDEVIRNTRRPVDESKELSRDKVPVPAEKLTALQRENALLKREIGAFDSEFFEQLEDLKYRYSRLQEIVGESPGVSKTATATGGNGSGKLSPSKSKLPLDRLAWSTRNSMTAIDKAAYSSDLISRPRYPNAYTYSPGGESKYSNSHVGGAIPSTRRVGSMNDDLDHLRSPKKFSPTATGGFHGIGTGTHTISSLIHDNGDSLSSLCERRLAFELNSHPAPEQATRSLVHRVMEVTGKRGDGVYISAKHLSDVIASVGLKMAPKEIEMICSGFASDGRGGIDAIEFCEMVKTLLYNLVGEHAARAAETLAEDNSQREKGEYYRIMEELCEDIITHDKHAIIGSSRDLFKLFVQFFMEKDQNGTGVVTFESFSEVLKDIGAMLSYEDKFTIATAFVIKGDKAATAFPSSNLNHINAFKTMKLQGSLSGASKSNASFGDWLSSSQMNLDNYNSDMNDFAIDNMRNILIEYPQFVTKLVEILEKYIDTRGGMPIHSKIPWFLKEYEFINILITQLEAMRPSQRRKVLMTLQYSLNVADPKQDGSLDGFAVLNGLLSSGFVLQRFNRVQLLRAVEEMGGKMNYQDLCQVLLNSSSAWFQEEKSMVMKILKSMGTTVTQKRSWLAHLRLNLIEASARLIKKHGDWVLQSNIIGVDNDLGIPPSAFLHCLRDCGVDLTVEEEATLLDCLDTERLAQTSFANRKSDNGATLYNGIQGKEHWSIPLIQFESFLNFCGRHCGEWYDAAPEIHESIKIMFQTINNPALCVQEFISLLHGFDEKNNGEISKRSFQICCHRSRLFANLPELKINKVAEILAIDGGGKVRYPSFVIYLQSVSSEMNLNNNSEPTLINQLIQRCSDTIGTLLPLRNWLIKHTDMSSYILTKKDLNAMLREFSIIYRPEDLDLLIMQIGKKIDSRSNTAMDNIIPSSIDVSHTFVVDSRDLLAALLKSTNNWTIRYPDLCRKIKHLLKSASGSFLSEDNNSKDEYHSTFHHKVRGVETAVARKLLTRLRAFASKSKDVNIKGESVQTVEKDVFAYLTKIAGISLTDEEIFILADATDNCPDANRIRCNVILDAIIFDPDQVQLKDFNSDLTYGSTMKRKPISEAGVFALEHIRHLLWSNAARLHRTSAEWIADVRAVFQGFDYGNTGFIATEDFQIALSLLNSTVSHEMLLNISYFPEIQGLIEYRDVLNYLLVLPTEKTISNDHDESNRTLYMKEDHRVETAKFKVKSKADRDSPIRVLIHVVRQSLNQFIVSDHSLEAAWVHLLKVFKRFDPQETNKISPRDFCLAVSVLMEGEEVVLTKPEWSEIIDYFSANLDKTNTNGSIYGGVQVDYMLFCESVLDPHDLDIKIRDYRTGDLSRKIDRSKEYLSKSIKKPIRNETGNMNATFDGTVTGSSFSNNRITSTNNRNNSPNKNKTYYDKNDDIVRKFRDSSDRTKTSTLDGMTQVSRNERSKSPWNTDNLYRTNKLKDQRLKDSTLAKVDHSIFDNLPNSHQSTRDVYSSSHKNAKSSNRFR